MRHIDTDWKGCDDGNTVPSRLAIPLGADTSISFDEPTSVSVKVHTAQGQTSYLVIRGTNPLRTDKSCEYGSEGKPIVHTSLPGAEKFSIPLHIELRIAISKPIIMPFRGLITVGGSVADDRGFLLNSGIGAAYLEDRSGLKLIKQTDVFPGDIVRFARSGCEIASTGFVRLDRYADLDTLQVISSARSTDALLSVTRLQYSSETFDRKGEIILEANALDKLLNDSLIGIFGGLITALVLCIELFSLILAYIERHPRAPDHEISNISAQDTAGVDTLSADAPEEPSPPQAKPMSEHA